MQQLALRDVPIGEMGVWKTNSIWFPETYFEVKAHVMTLDQQRLSTVFVEADNGMTYTWAPDMIVWTDVE